jgi:integrase
MSAIPGIQKDRNGFRAFVRVPVRNDPQRRSKLISKRFPPTAGLREMKAWREEQRVRSRARSTPAPTAGTFAADVDRYLRQVAAMPTFTWRRRDLYAWREYYGDLPRAAMTTEIIRAQLQTWRTVGPVHRYNPRTKQLRRLARPLSAAACNHRRTALLHLWTVLDGKDAPNPVRAVPPFQEPPPAPRARDLDFLEAAIARLRNPQQRARARVLLWTGIRGVSELGKMRPEHVDLKASECHVPTGKGGKRFRFVPLNQQGRDAWATFIEAGAWGTYDKDALRKSIARACRRELEARGLPPAHVRTYDLRHSIATAYLRAGADIADVQDLLGHTTARMTRRYAPQQRAKLLAAAKALE